MSRISKIESPRQRTGVSYLFAAAFALAMAGPVMAQDAASTPKPATPQATRDGEPQAGSHIVKHDKVTDLGTVNVFGGAVHGAGDSQWTDDDASAAELPVVQDTGMR